MANKKPRRRKGGIMGRSDIPYTQRLKMQQTGDIGWSREQGARVVMWCWAVALHQVEGIGYTRQIRFEQRFREVDREFYSQEIELSLAQAKRRLASMGIEISGELMVAPHEEGRTVREMEIKNHTVQSVQCAIICGCMAANDVFGFAAKPLERIRVRVEELSARYAKEGEGFLLEYMEKLGFTIRDGRVIGFLDEDGNPMKVKEVAHESQVQQ